MIEEILIYSVAVALLISFIIMLLRKQQLVVNTTQRLPKFLHTLFWCDFCFSFWLSLIAAIVISVNLNDYNFLIICIFSTPISRFIL